MYTELLYNYHTAHPFTATSLDPAETGISLDEIYSNPQGTPGNPLKQKENVIIL